VGPERRGAPEDLVIARIAALALAVAALGVAVAHAGPVAVRLPEGNTRGFLVVRAADGTAIGHGELRQKPRPPLVESSLVLDFKDGSHREETVVFSQDKAFRLEAYRLVERGPGFPATAEVSFDRKSGQYRARFRDRKGGEEQAASGELEMPADLYNGMALVLLKNLADGERASGQMAAFLPKPRLIKMELGAEGDDRGRIGAQALTLRRYLVKLQVGGLTGVVASLIGKEPPDVRYWLATGDVPAFARFEGAMFLNGPVWRIEMTPIDWTR
jgi:hypothetical protein